MCVCDFNGFSKGFLCTNLLFYITIKYIYVCMYVCMYVRAECMLDNYILVRYLKLFQLLQNCQFDKVGFSVSPAKHRHFLFSFCLPCKFQTSTKG